VVFVRRLNLPGFDAVDSKEEEEEEDARIRGNTARAVVSMTWKIS